jgi:cytochrome c biogenesis protein CcmG, thiol:disulfide interchange protein DsbE
VKAHTYLLRKEGMGDVMKKLLVVTLMVSVLMAILPSAYGAPLRVGSPPPDLSLPLLAGGTVRLPSALQGKVAIIHFWSTGCSTTCRDEMSAMETLFAAYRNRGVAVVVVNVGQKGGEVREFLKGVNPSYAVALDQDRKGALSYDVVDLPRTFILDRKGLIRYKVIGGASEGTLKKMVLSLL